MGLNAVNNDLPTVIRHLIGNQITRMDSSWSGNFNCIVFSGFVLGIDCALPLSSVSTPVAYSPFSIISHPQNTGIIVFGDALGTPYLMPGQIATSSYIASFFSNPDYANYSPSMAGYKTDWRGIPTVTEGQP